MKNNRLKSSISVAVLYLCSACMHVQGSQPEIVLAIGEIETLNLRRLRPGERVRQFGKNPTTIMITNACGKAEAVFNIEASTPDIGPTISTTQNIGEWCKNPYDFDENYFLVLEDNLVLSATPVLYTDSSDPVIIVNQDFIDALRESSGLALEGVIIETFPEAVMHPDFPNPNDPDIRAYVEASEVLTIGDVGDRQYVLVTSGVMLKRIFPELWGQ